ncbi:hypothetical protein E2562_014548 [Oryza meyeriana var. granulata]|uniref:No apical meristem-associated C-terminal domain-containing protein n=1 Tax=Oryza meyeriana var. granulata TaxID=110450 RepID=A0A6G1EJH6_9ORYZ|nr:hypothetical protein E2562_014548 [Oryza meyeriana var. granulata]
MSPSGRNNTGGRGGWVAAGAGWVVVGGGRGSRVGAGGGRLGAGSERDGLVEPDNSHGGLVEPDNSHGGRSGLGQAASHGSRVAATVGRGSGVVSSTGAAATDGRSYGPGGGAFSRGGGGTARELKNARKRKEYHLEGEGEENDEGVEEMPKRPLGQKAAKKAALAAKGKAKGSSSEDDGNSKESAIDVDKLDRLGKIQESANANRMKILELQQKLSSEKLETTKLAHLTAQETKEGKRLEVERKKLEKESKMMEAYNNLILQDSSSMSTEEKAERIAAMKSLRKMLFPESI